MTDPLHRRLRESLYAEAMLLADEARSHAENAPDEALDPATTVLLACESLKVTTRILHVVGWLLTRRAIDAGEIAPVAASYPANRLGESPVSDPETLASLPDRTRELVEASIELHRRVGLLDAEVASPPASPARAMQDRLNRAF